MARPRKEERTEPLQLRIPSVLKRELKVRAAELDVSMSHIMLEGYELWKKKHKAKLG